ncbi:MAG: ABC transporter ATP-binding protein [Myxococcota bacterium]
MTLIAGRSLSFGYRDAPVLTEVDIEVRSGELLGIIGPNGAGKSTLLRLLVGIAPLQSGSLELGSQSLRSFSRRELARKVAFVPQTIGTDFAFRVRDVVAMGRTPHLGRLQPETPADRDAIERALSATDLGELRDRPFGELSGGERQRVVLARALAQDTKLLVLDEPTAHLDLYHSFALLQLIRSHVDQGGGTIVALHDPTLALRFCDRLLLLHRGRVHADGPAAEVLSEENLRSVFGVDAVTFEAEGQRYVGVRRALSTRGSGV